MGSQNTKVMKFIHGIKYCCRTDMNKLIIKKLVCLTKESWFYISKNVT